MTVGNDSVENGVVKVNLASQVAGIAAQVTTALLSGEADVRQELENKLAQAHAHLQQGPAPDGLLPFIEVMRALLRGEDASESASELPATYRAVYDQLVQDIQAQQEPGMGDLTVGQVLEQVAQNAVLVIKHGTYAQQRLMANTLLRMQQESTRRPDLSALADFLEATRALLQDEDWALPASRLQGPFQARWEEILNELDSGVTLKEA